MARNINKEFRITEVELIYRNKVRAPSRKTVKNSQDAYDMLLASWDLNKIELLEDFKIMLLDRRSACMGIAAVARGGIESAVIDPKIVFATALKARASAMILAHNHPSGSLEPSPNDVALTHKLAAGGMIVGVKVMDHLIVTRKSYKSFADEGLML